MGHSTGVPSLPLLSPPCLGCQKEKEKKRERELLPACLYFIIYLCGKGGNLGHHFVSGLKYFLFHKQSLLEENAKQNREVTHNLSGFC